MIHECYTTAYNDLLQYALDLDLCDHYLMGIRLILCLHSLTIHSTTE